MNRSVITNDGYCKLSITCLILSHAFKLGNRRPKKMALAYIEKNKIVLFFFRVFIEESNNKARVGK